MRWLRKWMILTHRYLGIVLSLLFVVWFVSGIAMIYAGGMPTVTAEDRIERMPALDFDQVRLSPVEAAEAALLDGPPARVLLLTVLDRPAYRFASRGAVTVFADTGEVLADIGRDEARTIAARFLSLPEERLDPAGILYEADQWTIGERGQLPLHKFTADDGAGGELYVSERSGEVEVYTTRGSRALAWVAAIPHWLYFAPLRLNDALWRQVVLWTAGLGTFLALIGLIVAVLQFSPSRPFRWSRILSYVPYSGWMRWHYVTGVLFGVFALTWVFSGMLSMEPLYWTSNAEGLGAGVQQALNGGPVNLALFPPLEAAAWERVTGGREVKEIEFRRIQDDPYYAVRTASPDRLLVRPAPLAIRHEPFSLESILARVESVYPDVPVLAAEVVPDYDSYYYVQDRTAPLPVLRMKFDDPGSTWLYLDPGTSQLVARYTRRERISRWIYNGFHSLDFGFWYYNRPLWDIGVIVLSLGGAASSGIGLYLGIRRLRRGARRAVLSRFETPMAARKPN